MCLGLRRAETGAEETERGGVRWLTQKGPDVSQKNSGVQRWKAGADPHERWEKIKETQEKL